MEGIDVFPTTFRCRDGTQYQKNFTLSIFTVGKGLVKTVRLARSRALGEAVILEIIHSALEYLMWLEEQQRLLEKFHNSQALQPDQKEIALNLLEFTRIDPQ